MPLKIRRPQWRLLLVSFVIAGCLVAIVYALSAAVTGDEGLNLPKEIEAIEPVRGPNPVPNQISVVVDLLTGYEGVLVIDGLELETVRLDELQTSPGQQVSLPPTTIYEPGNATLTFDPSENSEISEFSQGQHVVRVIYWKSIEGRGAARSYAWSFEVF